MARRPFSSETSELEHIEESSAEDPKDRRHNDVTNFFSIISKSPYIKGFQRAHGLKLFMLLKSKFSKYGLPNPKAHPSITDVNLIVEMRHYVKYAIGVYGVYPFMKYNHIKKRPSPRLAYFYKKAGDWSEAGLTDYEFYTNSEVICNYNNQKYPDVCFVCSYCHERDEFVIAIRGTTNLDEAVIDIIGASDNFYEGYAHEGFLTAASNVYALIHPYLKLYQNSRISVTGHSLGAGISALIAIMAQRENFPVNAYCYACPPCVSKELAFEAYPYIYTHCCNVDVVPRLAMTTIVERYLGSAQTGADPKVPNKFYDVVDEKHLIVPGCILHTCITDPLWHRNKVMMDDEVSLWESDFTEFLHITIQKSMLRSHFVKYYWGHWEILYANYVDKSIRKRWKSMKHIYQDELIGDYVYPWESIYDHDDDSNEPVMV